MATQLKNIIRFVDVAPGDTVQAPHGLAWSPPGGADLPQVPDHLTPSAAGFVVTADDTFVFVTNTNPVAVSVDVLCELWHTFERAFGAQSIEELVPRPFVEGSAGGGGGGSPVNVQDEGVLVGTRPTLNFIGDGVMAADDPGNNRVNVLIPGGGGAGEPCVLGFGVGNIGAAAGNRFLDPWYGGNQEVAATVIVEKVAPRAGMLQSLFVRHNRAVGNGNNVVYTILVNGVVTLLAATLATGAIGQVSDLVNMVAVAQGDRVALRASKAASIGNGQLEVAVTMEFA